MRSHGLHRHAIALEPRAADAAHAGHTLAQRSAGLTYLAIASQTGLSRTGVFDICKRHDAAGPLAMRDRPNGHKTGHGRLLLPAQESLVCALIAEHTPEQVSQAGLLWTPAGVAQLIAQRFGVRVQRRAMRLYLNRWGHVRHARMERSRVRDAPALLHWLACDLPAIQMRARLEAAEIHWAHAGTLMDAASGTAPFALLEEASIRAGSSSGEGLVLSTVTNKGSRFWMSAHGPLDAPTCINFLRRLTQGRDHKIFLMLDWPQLQQAEVVAVWLAEHDELIEVFCLPRQDEVQVRPNRSCGGLSPSSPESTGDF